MSLEKKFNEERAQRIKKNELNRELICIKDKFLYESIRAKYSYNFNWLGRPIIQYPQDIIAMQEIIWQVRPELIIETGIAHGGSLILHASILELIGEGEVVGVDIDIRSHNRKEIEAHKLYKRIRIIEGSSVSDTVLTRITALTEGKKRVLVCLDSLHTHEHVLKELELYSPFVKSGSYLVVFDTIIEDLPNHIFSDRSWGKGNNPKTAAREFLKHNDRFIIDQSIQNKLLITVAPSGYLKCIKD